MCLRTATKQAVKVELITAHALQVPVGVYPEGVIKYKCASEGYTAWWQRKLYFTFMTTYILVLPAVFMTFCYVNVVLVVWRRSRELSAPKTPTIRVEEQSGNDRVGETGSRPQQAEANLLVRSHSDVGRGGRFCRLRLAATRSERAAADGSHQLRSVEADELSIDTGNRFSRRPRSRLNRRLRRAATERGGVAQSRSLEADELCIGTGSRSNVSSTTSPPLRRAAFNVAAMSRARVRTVQMTLCIVCSFIACWTPYFTVHLIHIWSHYQHKMPETVYVFAETLALVNSAVNPLLYACFNASVSCRRRPPVEQVDLHRVGTSRAGSSVYAAADSSATGRRTWPRTSGSPSTWYGRRVDGAGQLNVRGRAAGSNSRGASLAPPAGSRCDMAP